MSLQNIFRLCLLFCTVGLIYQLLHLALIKSALVVALFGIIWFFGQMRGWRWVSHMAFVLFAAMAVRVMFSPTSPEWILVIFTMLLCAWDLEYFVRRLKRNPEVRKQEVLEKRHLRRLMSVALLGLATGELIFISSFELNLVWMAILSIGAASGLYLFLSGTRAN